MILQYLNKRRLISLLKSFFIANNNQSDDMLATTGYYEGGVNMYDGNSFVQEEGELTQFDEQKYYHTGEGDYPAIGDTVHVGGSESSAKLNGQSFYRRGAGIINVQESVLEDISRYTLVNNATIVDGVEDYHGGNKAITFTDTRNNAVSHAYMTGINLHVGEEYYMSFYLKKESSYPGHGAAGAAFKGTDGFSIRIRPTSGYTWGDSSVNVTDLGDWFFVEKTAVITSSFQPFYINYASSYSSATGSVTIYDWRLVKSEFRNDLSVKLSSTNEVVNSNPVNQDVLYTISSQGVVEDIKPINEPLVLGTTGIIAESEVYSSELLQDGGFDLDGGESYTQEFIDHDLSTFTSAVARNFSTSSEASTFSTNVYKTSITNTSSGEVVRRKTFNWEDNTSYVFKINARKGNIDRIRLRELSYNSNAGVGSIPKDVIFNLTNGTFVNEETNLDNVTMTSVGTENGDTWYECAIYFTTSSTQDYNYIDVGLNSDDTTHASVGDYLFIEGAELLKSYSIPTSPWEGFNGFSITDDISSSLANIQGTKAVGQYVLDTGIVDYKVQLEIKNFDSNGANGRVSCGSTNVEFNGNGVKDFVIQRTGGITFSIGGVDATSSFDVEYASVKSITPTLGDDSIIDSEFNDPSQWIFPTNTGANISNGILTIQQSNSTVDIAKANVFDSSYSNYLIEVEVSRYSSGILRIYSLNNYRDITFDRGTSTYYVNIPSAGNANIQLKGMQDASSNGADFDIEKITARHINDGTWTGPYELEYPVVSNNYNMVVDWGDGNQVYLDYNETNNQFTANHQYGPTVGNPDVKIYTYEKMSDGTTDADNELSFNRTNWNIHLKEVKQWGT